MAEYELAIVGAGMFGSAAARHAAEAGLRTIVIGPNEPIEGQPHHLPFGSHHDAGRITRRIDPDPDWALIADRAIARYPEIEEQSGIRFHRPTGVLMIGPSEGDDLPFGNLIAGTRATADAMGLSVAHLGHSELQERFPVFNIGSEYVGIFEGGEAGVINPRSLVAAQLICAKQNGAHHHIDAVKHLEEGQGHVTLTCRGATQITAERVIIATGGYADFGLLPKPIASMTVRRTVTLLRAREVDSGGLDAMPCVIFTPRTRDSEPYLLPPVIYPDGERYIKIGGEPEGTPLSSEQEINDWFQSGGSAEAEAYQQQMLRDLMPGLTITYSRRAACVYLRTPNERLVIEQQGPRLTACAGGNGFGAKGSDEIGRMAVHMALHGDVPGGYSGGFAAQR